MAADRESEQDSKIAFLGKSIRPFNLKNVLILPMYQLTEDLFGSWGLDMTWGAFMDQRRDWRPPLLHQKAPQLQRTFPSDVLRNSVLDSQALDAFMSWLSDNISLNNANYDYLEKYRKRNHNL